MSGLAGLLAAHRAPGVYRWSAAFEVEDVRHAVEHAGWAFAHLDGWTHPTRAEVLAALGEALGFPDHYGANLDALHDCLRDLPGPTVLLWDGWGPLARADAAAFAGVRAVLAEHADRLAVLLRGDGPSVDVPLLD